MRTRTPGAAAIYARVSTGKQAQRHKTSLPRQVKKCRAAAAALGLTVRDEYIVEEAHSASDPDDRPGLEALYAAAARGEFRYVVMDVIDRTTRAGPFDLPHICERFRELGVEPIWAGHPDLDVTTPAGQVEAAKLAIWAFEDKETIARRFADGKAERIEGGKLIRAFISYGYRWNAERPDSLNDEFDRYDRYDEDADDDEDPDPRETWEPDPHTAPTVQRILTYLADGWRHHTDASAAKVMNMLNAEGISTPSAVKRLRRRASVQRWKGLPARWQVSTIRYIVHNPAYKGERVQLRWRRDKNHQTARPQNEWRIVEVPALVPPDVWEDANKQLARNEWGAHRQPRQFTVADVLLYGGHVRCASCGHTMSPRLMRGKTWTYSCVSGGRPADERKAAHPYNAPSMLVRTVDDEVWQAAVWILSDPDYLRERLRRTDEVWPPEAQMQHYAALVAQCDAVEATLARKVLALGDDSDLAGLVQTIKEEAKCNAANRAEYASKLAATQREYDARAERESRITAFVKRTTAEADRLDDLSAAERRQLLLDLGVQVRVAARGDPNRPRLSVLFSLSEEAATHADDDALETLWFSQTAGGDDVTVLALPVVPTGAGGPDHPGMRT